MWNQQNVLYSPPPHSLSSYDDAKLCLHTLKFPKNNTAKINRFAWSTFNLLLTFQKMQHKMNCHGYSIFIFKPHKKFESSKKNPKVISPEP